MTEGDENYRDASAIAPTHQSQQMEAVSAVTESTESKRYFIQNGGIGLPHSRPPYKQAVQAK